MGWLKKLMWKRRKLCYFIDRKGEVVQEWFAADVGAYYVVCEVAALQVCYQVPRALMFIFMKEKKLDDTKLSCA
jgi:hypothetical protein